LTDALRGRREHPDLTLFRLCQEFGWTPHEVRTQRAVDIEKFVLILNELEHLSTLAPDDEDFTTIVITED
jgi:hypothetical protein